MARRITHGFELRSLGNESPGEFINSPNGLSFPAGRYGGYCYSQATNAAFTTFYWGIQLLDGDISGEWFCRLPIYISSMAGNPPTYFRFRDALDRDILRININPLGSPPAFYNGSTLLGSLASGHLLNGTWRLLRIHYKPGTVDGILKVYWDGSLDINITAGNTNPNGYGALNKIGFYTTTTSGNYLGAAYLDDIALNDSAGSDNNDLPDDGQIFALYPNANGDSSQFIGSDGNSVDNYALVDENPPNGADYVQSNVSTDKDLYNMQTYSLQPSEGIRSLRVVGLTQSMTAVPLSTGKFGIKTGGSEVWGDEFTPPYGAWKLNASPLWGSINPVTGVAWTQADLDAIQAGIMRM